MRRNVILFVTLIITLLSVYSPAFSQTPSHPQLSENTLSSSNIPASRGTLGNSSHPNGNRFILESGGTVVMDNATGLMWQRSGETQLILGDDADAYVDSLNRMMYAGYSDWRLPTLIEAKTLLQQKMSAVNNLYLDPIFDREQAWIITSNWTNDNWPYVVYYTSGEISNKPIGYFGVFVRLVRMPHSASLAVTF